MMTSTGDTYNNVEISDTQYKTETHIKRQATTNT